MNSQTIDNVMDALEQYDELDYNDKEWLVDGVLDILNDIHNVEGDFEGRYYQGIMYVVEKGADIPKLFQIINTQSPLTSETYKLKIMMIKEVRQNKNGNIVMELLCEKVRDK